ncbi:MAG: hypothetical protein NTW21_03550 [Verrucomicrobia bacterium]|nr:hypothetical protein [Verrucomicrobiota bacterium]
MNTTKSNDESAEQPAEISDQGSDQSSEPRRDAACTLGELLDRATQFDRTAGTSSDAEEWFRAESKSLLHWAKETGRVLSSAQLDDLIAGFKLLNGGLEHQVFFKKRSGRVFKITKPPHFGHTWFLRDYVQNLIWCNRVFEDDIRLEGIVSTSDGVSLVISQPYIIGRSPSEDELVEWFELQGAIRVGKHRWKYPNGMVVSDAHTGNLIFMTDGSLVPIDVHVENPGSQLPELS